jgi:type II secretory pathway pseudopilin PulG
MKTNIRKIIYHLRHRYLSVNNVVMIVAFLIAASWIWGALGAMQRNYSLQRSVDLKKQQLQVAQLQTTNLQLQQNYYKTAEYQELALRESLGMALPGEHQLILPPNSQAAIDADANTTPTNPTSTATTSTNLEQWVNFLFGGYSKTIDGK